MARQTSAMDGFVPRRSERKVGGIIGGEQLKKLPPKQQVKLEPEKKRTAKAQTTGMQRGISRNEIDASLSGLDDIDNEESKKTR